MADFGLSFSPINPRLTEEELELALSRLFGGGEGVGAGALPAPRVRGIPPSKLFDGAVGRRPSVAEIFAPEAPAIVEWPELAALEIPEVPAPALEAQIPERGETDIIPPGDLESNPFLGSPGNVPSPGGGGFITPNPLNPFAGIAPTGEAPASGELIGGALGGVAGGGEALTPEEQEFLESIFGEGFGGREPFAV